MIVKLATAKKYIKIKKEKKQAKNFLKNHSREPSFNTTWATILIDLNPSRYFAKKSAHLSQVDQQIMQ